MEEADGPVCSLEDLSGKLFITSGACCIKAWQGCHALQLHGKGCLVHKSVATLLGLANKAEICGLGFGPAKSAAAQVRGISASVTMSILS